MREETKYTCLWRLANPRKLFLLCKQSCVFIIFNMGKRGWDIFKFLHVSIASMLALFVTVVTTEELLLVRGSPCRHVDPVPHRQRALIRFRPNLCRHRGPRWLPIDPAVFKVWLFCAKILEAPIIADSRHQPSIVPHDLQLWRSDHCLPMEFMSFSKRKKNWRSSALQLQAVQNSALQLYYLHIANS